MKKKTIAFTGLAAVVLLGLLTYLFVDMLIEPPSARTPASIPENYEAMSGCEKQAVLWQKVQSTAYQDLPEYRKMGLPQVISMSKQEMSIKGNNISDFAPAGWKKYIHGRGALAKTKIVPVGGNYTGLFKGADCAFLRLSLTYRPAGKMAVAPGLAFKVLRDGVYSANISALVSLDGQAKDFNFFEHPMSNIVPIGKDFGQKIVHHIFKSASKYPEEILASDMASLDAHGQKVATPVAPRQLFFVPGPTMKFENAEHEVRKDFFQIPAGTLVYQLFVAGDEAADFDYSQYDAEKAAAFLTKAQHVADIVTTSEFISSEFGDDGMFFRHQLR